MRHVSIRTALILALTSSALLVAARAEAQLGALASPGPLAKAHAHLEGAVNCEKCHSAGRKVTPAKCLTCHAPIADRIARKVGVHRNAANDCVSCHVEHAGIDAELRPFNQAKFDHAAETGFSLDGKHAGVAGKCTACHKTRSFVTAKTACSACHADAHKGSLGTTCEKCHSTKADWKTATTGFDHAVTAFPLVGAHKAVECARCHVNQAFKGVKFASCTDCHRTPHASNVSTGCMSCHTNDSWKTRKFDHARTAFPLNGKHAVVDCARCHTAPMATVRPKSATCATCHADPHHGEFKQDCKSCHSESGFAGTVFDHRSSTRFALDDGHAQVKCESCHKGMALAGIPLARKSADFRGASTACASCHQDPHGRELGDACESCHSPRTFKVTSFVHPQAKALFAGRHSPLTCAACHKPATASSVVPQFKSAGTACASCHRDVHLGQVSTECQTCHSLDAVNFNPDRFAHDSTTYTLTGRHKAVACAKCHATATAEFPSGRGTAVKLAPIPTACMSCHQDTHLGQLGSSCETCHTTETFVVTTYTHRSALKSFFTGRHLGPKCGDCHKRVTGPFPGGRGTAVQFKVGTTCTSCHRDPHNGALGLDCGRCHQPEPLRLPEVRP